MTLKVIICYIGGVGSKVAQLVLSNPALELAGVLVHSEDKDGKDVGELIGVGPIGLKATRDVDALVALHADAMSWHGLTWEPEVVAKFLQAGTSVYSGIGGWYLPSEPEYKLLQEAAEQGGAALVAGGNIPGLISDVLPLFCSGYAGDIRFIRASQRNHIPNYPSEVALGQYLGIGQPVPEKPFDPSAELSQIDNMWMGGIRQSANLVAQGVGVVMDDLRLVDKEYGRSTADIVLQPSGLKVAKGTVAGVRWTFRAFSNGKPFYELTNEQTTRLDIGPGWRDREDLPNWHVVIEGTPTIHCDFGLQADAEAPDPVAALNAARAVNFLPRVAAAPPGWHSVLDVPAPAGTLVSNG